MCAIICLVVIKSGVPFAAHVADLKVASMHIWNYRKFVENKLLLNINLRV